MVAERQQKKEYKMKRTYILVLILCLLTTSFAFADSREITASNFRECLSIINEVDPVETTQVVLEDGTEVRQEIRVFEFDNGNIIKNIRTYAIKATTRTFSDEWMGLLWGGIPGAGGTLKATYTYTHPTLMAGGDKCTTKIISANGAGVDLDPTAYQFLYATPSWETNESFNARGEVSFKVKQNIGTVAIPIWAEMPTVVNTCVFDEYGIPTSTWS